MASSHSCNLVESWSIFFFMYSTLFLSLEGREEFSILYSSFHISSLFICMSQLFKETEGWERKDVRGLTPEVPSIFSAHTHFRYACLVKYHL